MSTADLRLKYQENIEVISKLKSMLETCDQEGKKIVQSSIELVEKEQKLLVKKLRTNMYQNVTKKEKALFKDKEPVLDEDENVVYDISDVKISDVKEDTHLKVINITGEEDKKNDDVTEVLKKEVVNEEELKDAKIVFDGTYKLIYNNGNSTYEQKTNEVLLDLSLDDKDIYHNFNITNLLKNFDSENNTHLNGLYVANQIPVVYNFSKLDRKYDKKIAKKTKRMAKREKKNNNNVSVFNNSFKKFKTRVALAASIGIMSLGGLLGSLSKNRLNDKDNSVSQGIVSDAGVTDASYEAVEIKGTPVIEEIPELDLEKDDVPVIDNTMNEKVEETKEESIKIGDTYELNDVDLYRASTDEAPLGDTEYAQYTKSIFEINLIAVVYNNQVMRLVNNDSLDIDALETICKEKYGDDFKIFVNPNELDKDGNLVTENVGWIPLEQVQNKGKVLKR